MKINRKIVAAAPQLPAEREVGEQAAALGDDDVVQRAALQNDRRGDRLDNVGEMRTGKMLAKRTNGRGGEDDVANFAETDEQDLQGSIVASSMSITGMSSLMGYTR
jgi:hypothetical protein